MSSSLSQRAMLVRLSISQWTARKYDRTASQVVASQYNTETNVGRYNKALVPERAVRAISQAAHALRRYHYANTLPWNDDHYRLLPSANYTNYTQEFRQLKANFDNPVHKFIQNDYPILVNNAPSRLNGMFDPKDFPSQVDLATMYNVDVIVTPLPDADDFRVSLGDNDVEAIKKDIEARTEQAQAGAMSDLWKRLYSAVQNMAERLSDKDNIFRDSLVQNITDLCTLLPRLNVMNDPQLEFMREQIEQKLCVYTPKDLRTDQFQRGQAAADASDILASMSGYMGATQ